MNAMSQRMPLLIGDVVSAPRPGDHPTIRVWCPYCHRFHIHGWPNGGRRRSHRVAHCYAEDSPFRETGYNVKPRPAEPLS